MQETENIKLQKPSENEYINLQTLNDNADKVDAEFGKVENPPFDDSGTVQEISSFTDFVNSVKTKMNIFQFFRDFKAGMKYVLHAGRLANNAVTTEEGFALDARMGKVLQEQISDVNKNINGMIGFKGSIKDFALTCGKGLTVFGTNATATDLPEQTQEWEYTSGYVLRRNSSGNTLTIVLYGFLTNRIATLSHSDGQWTEWDIQTRNSDLSIIDYGSGAFGPVESLGIQTVNIQFNKKFNTIPKVVVSFKDTANIYDYCKYISLQGEVTQAGFTAQTQRLSNAGSWNFNWIAIGS